MQAARILKEKIQRQDLTLGVIASFLLWPDLVEICVNANLDYLIVDLEHGPFNDDLVAEVCTRGRLLNFPIIIRPHSSSFETVRKIMDMGPCGLMLAVVNDTSILDVVRDGVYMPPRGKRRPGGPGNRWISDFNYETWKTEVEDDLIILPQIETREGLSNAKAIAAHELTTAIAVGPYDLAADLGVLWKPTDPLLVNALDEIREAGKSAGKSMWVIGDPATLMAKGHNLLCITEPASLLEATLKANVANLRSGGAPAPASDVPLP